MYEDATSLDEFFAVGSREPGAARAVLGPRIRHARLVRLRGLNLEVFGRKIGELMERKRPFSNVTISNWETGRQEPSFEALIAISRLTHLPLRYFAGVGEMDDYPFIDWLVPEGESNLADLRELLGRVADLPPAGQQLVVAQLKSLIGDVHQVLGEAGSVTPESLNGR
jgi:transcriptional regulator with XRE-family HTH domain